MTVFPGCNLRWLRLHGAERHYSTVYNGQARGLLTVPQNFRCRPKAIGVFPMGIETRPFIRIRVYDEGQRSRPRKMSTKNFDALAAKSLPVSLPYAILIIATEPGGACTLEHIVCLELWSSVMRVA
jgi:hypothetical protein